jgi:hypothetical protein
MNAVAEAPLIASFRDPGGQVVAVDGRIIRVINKSAVKDIDAFLASTTAQIFADEGRLAGTRILDDAEIETLLETVEFKSLLDRGNVGMVVEQTKIPFAAYPHEWPPSMLHEAGCLTLKLAESLLAEGLGLKDATPYNILFHGPKPVFIDTLSFERRDPGDPMWLPHAQFVRTFLLPLLVFKYFGLPLAQIFTSHRDGLEPEEVYCLCGRLRKLTPPFLSLSSIPTWLGSKRHLSDARIYQRKSLDDPEKARFILQSLFKHLWRGLHKLTPGDG